MENNSEIYSNRVRAGKRTYFFDIKSTKSSEYYITITESKRVGEQEYEKHKIFIYKEDFDKFMTAFEDVVDRVKNDPTQQHFTTHAELENQLTD